MNESDARGGHRHQAKLRGLAFQHVAQWVPRRWPAMPTRASCTSTFTLTTPNWPNSNYSTSAPPASWVHPRLTSGSSLIPRAAPAASSSLIRWQPETVSALGSRVGHAAPAHSRLAL